VLRAALLHGQPRAIRAELNTLNMRKKEKQTHKEQQLRDF
jgi:hypothetical protein